MNTIRFSRKRSIAEFSEEIGISRSEMQKILKGTCNPCINTVEYIADRLGVHPSVLLFPCCLHPQMEFALLLLQTLEAFSTLPQDQQQKAADLFYQLICIQRSDKEETSPVPSLRSGKTSRAEENRYEKKDQTEDQ